jgi:HAD superfamily hydrolase (TIGR01509 family)
MKSLCIIFDLDGTLVDSEYLCNQAFLDLVPELNDTVETLTQRYRGQKLSLILTDIEQRIKHSLPVRFEADYRQRVSELFSIHLKPMPNVTEMLNSIRCATCVASSAPLAKIRQALQVSGLSNYFENRIFSSYEVGSWKPEPGLFQHAANIMRFTPEQCVVVEDSHVGIEAALAAKMFALHYRPNEGGPMLPGAITFNDMSEIPKLVDKFA